MGKMRQIHDLKDLGSVIKEARPASGAREQDSAAGPGPCRYGTLRPGQHVVMVDSDLEGTVLSLGKKVRVETEDGLVIEAGYSEVAPADLQEERQMVSGVMKPGRREKMAGATPLKSRYTNTLTIDLHIGALPGGYAVPENSRLDYQMQYFRRVLRENLCHCGMKITVIHGVGDGILRDAVRKELDEIFALHCSYRPGPPGVTVVTLR